MSSSRSAARARSSEVLERTDDGRLDILARGTRPFRLIERQDDLHYPAGVDRAPQPTRRSSPTPTLRRPPASCTPSWSSRPPTSSSRSDDLAAIDAYPMAGTVEFGPDAKQELLELRSETARLRLLARCSAPRSSGWSSSIAPRPERAQTARCASAEPHARSTAPRPPRRGSPAPLIAPVPAEHRLDAAEEQVERRRKRTISRSAPPSALASSGRSPARRRAMPSSKCTRGASHRLRARPGRGRRRRRSSAAAPSGCGWSRRCRAPARPRPSRSTTEGAIMLGIRRPAGWR